jgi:hypothetical protein
VLVVVDNITLRLFVSALWLDGPASSALLKIISNKNFPGVCMLISFGQRSLI